MAAEDSRAGSNINTDPISVRTLSAEEYDDLYTVFQSAFLDEPELEDSRDLYRQLFEPERFHGAFDDGQLIGSAGVFTRDMTLPGLGPRPVALVTAVAVAAGHRRRGVLSRLMRAQLHGLHEAGAEPMAALWASESGIYGRFGYGMAVQQLRLNLLRGAAFRPGIDFGTDRVRELPRDAALPLVRKIHDQVRPERVGWLSRTDHTIALWFSDREGSRGGGTKLRFAVHPEGYALYRINHHGTERGPRCELRVHELATITATGHAALWRYLLDVDLVGEVTYHGAPVDEPVVHLLADPRGAVRGIGDSLWVRLVDVDRALAQRRYNATVDVVLEVSDALCPWNAGRWRLRVGDSGVAEVERTENDADLTLDITDLGAAFLGGTRLTVLAAAQRVRELRPGALVTTSRAFADDREPHCPEVF